MGRFYDGGEGRYQWTLSHSPAHLYAILVYLPLQNLTVVRPRVRLAATGRMLELSVPQLKPEVEERAARRASTDESRR